MNSCQIPLGECLSIDVRPTDKGCDIYITDAEGTVKALSINEKTVNYCGHKITSAMAKVYYNTNERSFNSYELLLAQNLPSVIHLEDGRLFCRKCRCYVPNTANNEMRKEGVYAHSHVCGVRAEGEKYLDE